MADDLETIEQFGARIKAKYPDYAEMPDADIGARMLAKYPEYGDRVTPFTRRGGMSTPAQASPEIFRTTNEFDAEGNPVVRPSMGAQLGTAALNALPGIGGIVGGVLSTPETLGAGTIPGVALGVGAGRGLRDLLTEAFGLEKPTSATSKGARIALDTGEAAIFQAILPGVIEALKTPRATIADGLEAARNRLPVLLRPLVPDVSAALRGKPAAYLLKRPAWQAWQQAVEEAGPTPAAARTTGTGMTPSQAPPINTSSTGYTMVRPTAPSASPAGPPAATTPVAPVRPPPAAPPIEPPPAAPAPVQSAPPPPLAPAPAAVARPSAPPLRDPLAAQSALVQAAARAKIALTKAELDAMVPHVVAGNAPDDVLEALVQLRRQAPVAAPVAEAAAPRPEQVDVEGNIPASKSRRGIASATPGLTVADVEALGLNPNLPIKKLTPDMIARVMRSRAERAALYRSDAAFKKSTDAMAASER